MCAPCVSYASRSFPATWTFLHGCGVQMTGKSFKESMNVFGGVNVSSFTGGSSAKAASMAESSEYSQMPSDYAPPASA
ncbi:MAG: hypothetical protein EOO65_03410 [Methanosarcinales archaeon]|nr:MAG: hypothetical protein EOO65_03410 [Methanosarcinales archaeon]